MPRLAPALSAVGEDRRDPVSSPRRCRQGLAAAGARSQGGDGVALASPRPVDCRIQIFREPDGCTVQLAGRLEAAQAGELRYVCATATGHLRIDLTDLLSADAVGLDALRQLRRRGAELMGTAPYLRQWLA